MWAEHVTRVRDKMVAYQILIVNFLRKYLLYRPRSRWEDNIIINVNRTNMHEWQVNGIWRDLVLMVYTIGSRYYGVSFQFIFGTDVISIQGDCVTE